ncbi:MAG: hypothetical protein IKL88_00690 [Erysipelotrichales bacterium]|nr:hypothetical protein [Erysipelotrichales bacterium]
MEKKNLKSLIKDASKTAKDLVNTTIQNMDQNDDGKFDVEDVNAIAEAIGGAVKEGTQTVKENLEEAKRQLDLKMLNPIFESSFDEEGFYISKFIRILERDKKYKNSEVCQGSIGFISSSQGMYVVNIFRDSLEKFGLSFYPNSDGEFFYADPSEKNKYIALDEYFGYMITSRVDELEMIARDLGAKYFKVTLMEEQTSFTDKNNKIHFNLKIKADVKQHSTEKKMSMIKVAAEDHFVGHKAEKPKLKYWIQNSNIQSLIDMRMSGDLTRRTYMLQMSSSCGIKEDTAAKIDGILKGLKLSGNTTVSNEVQNESRRYLEYIIEF